MQEGGRGRGVCGLWWVVDKLVTPHVHDDQVRFALNIHDDKGQSRKIRSKYGGRRARRPKLKEHKVVRDAPSSFSELQD